MSSFKILKDEGGVFAGCDFVVQLPREREGSEVRILQLTDMQIIDSLQRRTPDRIRPDEIEAEQRTLCPGSSGQKSIAVRTKERDIIGSRKSG